MVYESYFFVKPIFHVMMFCRDFQVESLQTFLIGHLGLTQYQALNNHLTDVFSIVHSEIKQRKDDIPNHADFLGVPKTRVSTF